MSEPKQQQPKILLHKPKKNQRSPPGAPIADSASHDGGGASRGVSTASQTPPPTSPSPAGPNKPFWYRFRTAITTLLVLNAVLVGYTLFRTSFKSVEPLDEADSAEKKIKDGEQNSKEAEKEKEKPELVDTKKETPELSKIEAAEASKNAVPESPKVTLAAVLPPPPSVQVVNKPKPSDEEQQELYKWMLAEKRKIKPSTKAEKAQIDAEKALLKEYLRNKRNLDL